MTQNVTAVYRQGDIFRRRPVCGRVLKTVTMPKVENIHASKPGFRRHYLPEWMDARNMKVADLVRGLNDDERSMDLPAIDKKQVYRWMEGQMPHATTQRRIADALMLGDPEALTRHPDDDWFATLLQRLSADEKRRAREMLEAAFPRKAG